LAETAAINAMPDSEWYPALVEKLLADPRHGQRWARHWMDVWRYSDWWGLGEQLRNSQKHLWHWRDWIIESLNNDAPYDEMVRLMLAADEIAPEDASKLRATGFLARNWFLFNRNTWMEDTVEHVGKGFLGLTFNCSKCHDHKYDPISQTDFYRLRAVFEPYHVRLDVTAGGADLEKDGIPRAFDADAGAVTYRFVRGEESQPDKSAVISPGVPALFDFAAALGSRCTRSNGSQKPRSRRRGPQNRHGKASESEARGANKPRFRAFPEGRFGVGGSMVACRENASVYGGREAFGGGACHGDAGSLACRF
jgi:hypothetical protein